MKRWPPVRLRVPIFVDWLALGCILLMTAASLGSGRVDGPGFRLGALVAVAAVVLIVLDRCCFLRPHWALLPRAGVAFLLVSWCVQAVVARGFEHRVVAAVAVQQLWVLVACLLAEIRLRRRA